MRGSNYLEEYGMARNTGKSLIKGTMILVIGNIIVKIIGALFKLPLANIIGADGMGLYNASFIVFDIFLVLSTAGFPLAISKMVANSCAHRDGAEALKIFRVSRRIFAVMGIAFTLIMALGAKTFSEMIGNTRAYYSILLLSPAILFVSLMSSYRGYYQGTNDMIPTTVSQVTESLCRLIIGLSLSWYLKSAGYGTEIVAAGAIVGITAGEFASTFTLAMIHRRRMKRRRVLKKCRTNSLAILKSMFSTAIPIGISTIIIAVINMLDNSVVMHRLQFIGNTEQQANTLYGSFNMAFTVFSLPITIVSAITISVFPVLSYASACKNFPRVSKTSEASLRIAMIAATASTALFASLSYPIIMLLYFNQPRDAKLAAPLLMLLAPSAITISMTMLSTVILQAIDKIMVPSRSSIIGGAVCLASNWILVGNPKIGIYGAPVGIFICYAITSALNFRAIKKSGKIHLSFRNLFFKPLIPAAVMALTGALSFNAFYASMGLLKSAAFGILLGLFNFIIVLFLNHTVERGDLVLLPKGTKIIRALEKVHLLDQI